MKKAWERTAMLIGEEAVNHLEGCHVAVFGIGGVGGYVTEALARSGVGKITIVDHDTVSETNLNRQIIATRSTIGQYKTKVMKARLEDINPELQIIEKACFFLPENAKEFDFREYDYVVDAVDTVTAKLAIIGAAKEAGTPVISSMGTGNKLDASYFRIADISKTDVCPLAKVMRRELKKRNITDVKVLYSTEKPILPGKQSTDEESKKTIPGSISFVPSVAGLLLAGEVIRDLIRGYQG